MMGILQQGMANSQAAAAVGRATQHQALMLVCNSGRTSTTSSSSIVG
jgi:hypothetical protein